MEIGSVGAGKTHLAIGILRERLRLRGAAPMFIRHRQFMAEYFQSQRPVGFGQEPPERPMIRCQEASLLVYDELTAPPANRNYEDVLLDLFDYRVGNYLPTIVTTNLGVKEIEGAIGSRLLDRLRQAVSTVLEFGFESRRRLGNREYLQRAAPAPPHTQACTQQATRLQPRSITEVKVGLQAIEEWMNAHLDDHSAHTCQERRQLSERQQELERMLLGLE